MKKLSEMKIKQIKILHNQGYSNTKIAKELGISPCTVSIYKSAIRAQNFDYSLEKTKFKLKIIEEATPHALESKVEEFMQLINSPSERSYITGYKKYIAFIEYNEKTKEQINPINEEEMKNLSIKENEIILEKFLIRRALKETSGNVKKSSTILEISHRALIYKIKEYNLYPELESLRKL